MLLQLNGIVPDLIILGTNDSGRNHFRTGQSAQTVLACREHFKLVPVIVFEETYSIGSTVSYFQFGARGYLLKKSTENEFVKCIERVLNNKYYLSPDLHIRTLAEGPVLTA
ncbi:response regulator [Dyadobacter aurulentus]|uniref:response regulator transcription factor n=1 Tax=Dyadobacter sp. UC 10 TaxID=2605428 RepID=UPI0011F2919B|nr:response regulator transcription factor [Dyadobacter sp. UC 10]KAA0990059.1 response regulator transcription factor [Dyadobacter sp. UC 10]